MALNFANNNSLSAITALPASITGGALNLISTQTASSSSTLDFTSGLDSTYKEYIFKFINIHPATNAAKFRLIGSTDGGSSYGVATTTSMFEAMQDESGNNAVLRYEDGDDVAQSTSAFPISTGVGSDSDEGLSGYLHLFDPSNTTFVKHFMTATSLVNGSGTPYTVSTRVGGYFNSTSAITAVQFSFSSGAIESGVVKFYGIS
jgi:hypothetical protein